MPKKRLTQARTEPPSPKFVALWLLNFVVVACDGAPAQTGGELAPTAPNLEPSAQASKSDNEGTLDPSGGGTPGQGPGAINSNPAATATEVEPSSSAPANMSSDANAGASLGTGGGLEPTPDANSAEVPVAAAGGAGGSNGTAGSESNGGSATAVGGSPPTDAGDDVGGSSSEGNGGGTPQDEPFTGTCTASQAVMTDASGSGPHEVIVETNSDSGINEGTIFRPADLGGDEKYPIFVWGEGACAQDGLSNAAAMAEIASHGYFVVADGTPMGSGNRTMDRSDLEAMGAPLIAYVDWAIAENDKPCSEYYQSLEPTKVAANGFSCGGLMAQGTVLDPRIVTWGVTSSGMAGATQDFYDLIHTPVLFVEGGPAEVAYDGAREGYDAISALDVPLLWFSKDIGHGGDLFQPGGGDFTRINLAWLNWWLKGDETATGKGLLVGAECPYCSDSAWEVFSDDIAE